MQHFVCSPLSKHFDRNKTPTTMETLRCFVRIMWEWFETFQTIENVCKHDVDSKWRGELRKESREILPIQSIWKFHFARNVNVWSKLKYWFMSVKSVIPICPVKKDQTFGCHRQKKSFLSLYIQLYIFNLIDQSTYNRTFSI